MKEKTPTTRLAFLQGRKALLVSPMVTLYQLLQPDIFFRNGELPRPLHRKDAYGLDLFHLFNNTPTKNLPTKDHTSRSHQTATKHHNYHKR